MPALLAMFNVESPTHLHPYTHKHIHSIGSDMVFQQVFQYSFDTSDSDSLISSPDKCDEDEEDEDQELKKFFIAAKMDMVCSLECLYLD